MVCRSEMQLDTIYTSSSEYAQGEDTYKERCRERPPIPRT